MNRTLRLLAGLAFTTGSLWAKSVPVSQRVVRDGSANLVAWSGSDKDLSSKSMVPFGRADATTSANSAMEP
jgi:hypothetical protein